MDQPVSSETLGKTAHEVTTSQDFKTLVSRRWTVSTVLLVLLFASYYGYIASWSPATGRWCPARSAR